MRTIGLLGGMSWESTREYYRLINEHVRDAQGGLHSAPLLLHSFNFDQIAQKQRAGDWNSLDHMLANAAHGLESAGAETILICTNYMHKCAPAVEAATSIPLLHIADAIGQQLRHDQISTVGLLGARGTMEGTFYHDRLTRHGVTCHIPTGEDAETVDRIIFEELCQGRFTNNSRQAYLKIMDQMADKGVEAFVLACTEIEQLIRTDDTHWPLYPSAALHARAGADFILGHVAQCAA